MPDPRPLTGLFGKVPAHGDFVRRGLPTSFVAPWDAWLQAGMSRARAGLGEGWEPAWDDAPAWRFALPAGACGPDAVAGVMLPSADTVGRRFPITLAALLGPGTPPPGEAWFAALEGAALAGRAGQADADALAAAIPPPDEAAPVAAFPIPGAGEALPPAGLPGAAADEAGDPWGAPDPATEAPAGAPPHDPDSVGEIDFLAAFSAPAGEPGTPDVPLAGLFGEESTAPEPIPMGDAFAAFLAGMDGDATPAASTVRDAPASRCPESDPLRALLGSTEDAPPDDAGTDPLAALTGDADETPQPGWSRDGGPDPLAALIGGAEPPAVASVPSWSGDDRPDPLAALMGSAADTASDDGTPPDDRLVVPQSPDEAEQAGFAAAMPAIGGAAAEAPPAPESGGWWTRGAAQVPPMVWALPGLPSPDEFAYLLKAEA